MLVSWRTFGFWNVVSFVTDCLFTAAFTLRVIGIANVGEQNKMVLQSFQCLSFAAPLLWYVDPLNPSLSFAPLSFVIG